VRNVAAGSIVTALVVVSLFVAAVVLSRHRRLAAVLCGAGFLAALTKLTIGVHTHSRVTKFDAPTMSWFAAHQSPRADWVASVITELGSPGATAAAGLLCGGVLAWIARSVLTGVVVIGTVAAAWGAEGALKVLIERPLSPAELQLAADSHSFPSGHVTGTGVLLGIIAVCIGMGRSRIDRVCLTAFVLAGVLVVALARLYLNVHWLTDVVGGALLAGVFVSLGAAVMPSAPVHFQRSSWAH
jgi:membrane-associated phospholipid phosphatase